MSKKGKVVAHTTTRVQFAEKARDARKRANLSQIELARMAGVSPKTIAKIETEGVSRFDAIARIAKALGQPVDEWLKLAGQTVSAEKIDNVLNQNRITTVSPQLSPEDYFSRSIDRVKKYGNVGLRCICVMSPTPVAQPSVSTRSRWELVKEATKLGLHGAMVVPFPFKGTNISELPALYQYYTSAYNWAYQAVSAFRKELPVAANRVHVFTPTIPGGKETTLVYPPLRLAEVRPMLTQYGYGKEILSEYGVYMHFPDYRKDYYAEIYSSDQPLNQHGSEAFQMWHDYFRDIIHAWKPEGSGEKSIATYPTLNGLSAWQQAKV